MHFEPRWKDPLDCPSNLSRLQGWLCWPDFHLVIDRSSKSAVKGQNRRIDVPYREFPKSNPYPLWTIFFRVFWFTVLRIWVWDMPSTRWTIRLFKPILDLFGIVCSAFSWLSSTFEEVQSDYLATVFFYCSGRHKWSNLQQRPWVRKWRHTIKQGNILQTGVLNDLFNVIIGSKSLS